MSHALAERILSDAESSSGLAWFVRALLAIGAENLDTPQRLNLLEMLQSMLAHAGQQEALLSALEEVTRGLPGYDDVMAERQARGAVDGDDADAVKQTAAMQLLGAGATEAAATEVRALLHRIIDPATSPEERLRLQRAMNDLALRSNGYSPRRS